MQFFGSMCITIALPLHFQFQFASPAFLHYFLLPVHLFASSLVLLLNCLHYFAFLLGRVQNYCDSPTSTVSKWYDDLLFLPSPSVALVNFYLLLLCFDSHFLFVSFAAPLCFEIFSFVPDGRFYDIPPSRLVCVTSSLNFYYQTPPFFVARDVYHIDIS